MITHQRIKENTDIIKVLHDLAETTHRRSMFVIFSDLLDDPEKVNDLFQALEHMKHNKHEVILFHTVDKQLEVDFDLGNKPHKLIDMETGEEMKVEPIEIRESYKKEINKYFNEIAMRCLDQRIDFMPVDIHEDYDAVLLSYLLKRQKLN